jgi:spore coat polysaccharide biosynthesis protein SpsF (cytidylyltransferase family)
MQPLAPGVSILSQIIAAVRTESFVSEVVLAIADEPENRWLTGFAGRLGCSYVLGDTKDVLERLILAGESTGATDLVRKTTESPYFEFDGFRSAWRRHLEEENDITVVDYVPLGTAVEIYTMDALRQFHREGLPEDRSEFVSNYGRYNQRKFKVGIVKAPEACRRTDLRLTVDYPEDLIVCREIYARFADRAPRIPLAEIIAFLDERPDLTTLVAPYVFDEPIWVGAPQRE